MASAELDRHRMMLVLPQAWLGWHQALKVRTLFTQESPPITANPFHIGKHLHSILFIVTSKVYETSYCSKL